MHLFPRTPRSKYLQWVLLGQKGLSGFQMQMGIFLPTLCCLVTFLTTEFIAGTQKADSLSFLNLQDLLARQVTAGNEEATVSHLIEKADSFAASMAIEGSACLKKMVVNERLPTHGTASDSTAQTTWPFMILEQFISPILHTAFPTGLMMNAEKLTFVECFGCSQMVRLIFSARP